MAFLGLGWTELIIILVIVLVIFGPKRLPALGKSLGKTVKNVRDEMSGDGDDKDAAKEDAEEAAADAPRIEADVEDAEPVEVADDAKYCPECGAENPEDNAFCAKCGAKLQ